LHDPDNIEKPFWGMLSSCADTGAGTMKQEVIQVREYDFLEEKKHDEV